MKMKVVVFIFVSIFGHIFALKCFQGTLNTMISSRTGTAIDCPDSSDIACVMKYDSNQRLANYMCSKNNCSVNGVIFRESVCVNVSTILKNCCCYNDACSYWFLSELPPVPFSTSNVTSSPLTTPSPQSTTALSVITSSTATLLTSPKSPSTTKLKCLQGSYNTSDRFSMDIINFPRDAPECFIPNAITCQSQYDSFTKFVFFSCSTQNCTLNGNLISESICVNVSSFQKNCCCYGDACTNTIMANELKSIGASVNSNTTVVSKPPSTSSLRCLQGSFNVTQQSTLDMLTSPTAASVCMDPYTVTCRSQYDPTQKFAIFSCSTAICTHNGITIHDFFCGSFTTTQTNCCCYGDGCTSDLMAKELKLNTTSFNSNSTISTSKPPSNNNLKCLQGSFNVTQQSTIDMLTSPTAASVCMDPNSVTCRTQYDPTNKFVVFTCSTSNCTLNGMTVRDPICINATATQYNCCCYGDDCSTKLMAKELKLNTTSLITSNTTTPTNMTLSTSKLPSSDALKCLQGSINTTNPLIEAPSSCPGPNATTCLVQYDSYSKYATFTCSNFNCSLNNVTVRDGICVNISAFQRNCCCYGDGCNAIILADEFAKNSLSNPNTSVSKFWPTPGLRCLQGSMNTTYPITGSPVYCQDSNAATCRIQYDSSSKFATFSCSNLNCTLNNNTVRDGICVNTSTSQRQCCCYGDGCNALLLADEFAKNSNATTAVSTVPKQPTGSLKCLQGTINATNTAIGPATLCLDPYATTCIAQYDTYSKFALFTCSNSNCTLNGRIISTSICLNVSSYQTNCCCYGDDCNSANYATLKTSLFALSNSSTPTTLTIPQSPSGSLKCLQGTINATNSAIGPARLCSDPYATTCITQYDTTSKYATFTCSNSNCTLNGIMINTSVCVNITSYQSNCCCYGDDCNSGNYATLKSSLFSSTNSSINKNITSSLTTRDAPGCENGYKILSPSADASLAGKGKFAGYLGYRTSCQELCDKSFGLVKCVAYMFELHNRGKCTLFQQSVDSDIMEVLNSGASVSARC